ncbi:MFS transporter [Bacillus fungorum]|uniref:MFS transporter n=1 Tax=Bacillus fungorum TaxID=2039284 RepID=UPI00339B270C
MKHSYYLLWSSYLISKIGDWLYLIALPLIIYQKTDSAFQMATVYGIAFIPWLFFSLFGGFLADSFNKKNLIILGHFLSAFFVIALTILLTADNINLLLIYIGVFCLSSIEPLIHPSFHSMIPSIVEKEKIVHANSGLQLIENTLNLIGPVIGGSILAFMGGEFALIVNAISFVVAGLVTIFIKYDNVKIDKKPKTQSIGKTILYDIKDGFKYVNFNKIILFGSLLFFFTNLGIHLFQSNFMFYMADTLKLDSTLIGITMGISGVGPILGAIIAPYLNRKFASGKIILWCTVFAGAGMYVLLFATTFWEVAISQAFVMFFGNINVITYFSLRQKVVPPELLGRVISVTRMISYASIPLGAILGGYALQAGISIFLIIAIGATIRTGVGLLGFLTPLGSAGNIDYTKEEPKLAKTK